MSKGFRFDKAPYTRGYLTPVLNETEPFNTDILVSKFRELSNEMDNEIKEFVQDKLDELQRNEI